MTNEQLDKILAKIPTDKVYEDILQPSLKKAGEALSNVFDLGNLIMLPFKLVNERSRIYLKKNLERYEKKLEKIDENELCQVSEHIGLPILDKLTLVNQEELSEVFVNLLTKASTTKTLYLIHPSFFNILNNLSQDEAIILFANKECKPIPFIDIYLEKKTSSVPKPQHFDIRGAKSKEELLEKADYIDSIEHVSIKLAFNLTGIEKDMKLYFPQNIDIYLENLERSGIITFERELHYKKYDDTYEYLIGNVYNELVEKYEKDSKELKYDNTEFSTSTRRCLIEFTDFGKAFIDAVIKDIEEINHNNIFSTLVLSTYVFI